MDMLSQIFPTVIGDLLEYLSDINQKLSCLNKVMVKVSGAWNIKPFIEVIENNRSSLKYVGVTSIDNNIPEYSSRQFLCRILVEFSVSNQTMRRFWYWCLERTLEVS